MVWFENLGSCKCKEFAWKGDYLPWDFGALWKEGGREKERGLEKKDE